MNDSINNGRSGLLSFQKALDIESNNIANVNTVGFKSDNISFSDMMYQSGIGKGVSMNAPVKNFDQQQNTTLEDKISEIKERSEMALSALEASRAAMEQDFDEQTGVLLEPVMKEGRRLDEDLQEQMGVAARKDILFGATGDVIVQAGTVVASQHISKVQEDFLKTTGASGVKRASDVDVQVIYGPQVESIANDVKKALAI